jgi:hypothetical protein
MEVRTMKAGVHIMPAAEYHADPAPVPSLSSGIAKLLLTHSPLHAWTAHPRLNPAHVEEESQQFDLGTAAHALLLEGADGIAVIDPQDHIGPKGGIPKGWTNDSIRAARDAARAAGRTPILTAQFAEIEAMAKVARQAIADCPDLSGLTLADGTAEQVLLWEEPGGVWCRARPDWMAHERHIQISYKSTGTSANPSEWVRTGLGIGFDLQNAFYDRGNRATGGPAGCRSLTLVQENAPPYACSWLALDPAFQAMADQKAEEAIELWRRCLTAGRWPGYSPRVHYLEPPAWATARWEERPAISERAGEPPSGKMFSADDLKDGVPL